MNDGWERGLCVVAHPDDLEYGVASAVARWTASGKRVTYLLATRGEAGIQGRAPADVGPLREREERASAGVVGVHDVRFLDHHDGVLEYGLPLRRDIARVIRDVRPEIVVTMNFDLTWGGVAINHADHRAVGLAVLDAVRDAANEWVFADDRLGAAWAGVEGTYVAGVPDATHFVDVTTSIDRGVASLREHRAYIEGLDDPTFDPDQFLRSSAAAAASACGCEYAVTFRRYG
jgi:LmbE family N-acetylglucosaminyl deacetylase